MLPDLTVLENIRKKMSPGVTRTNPDFKVHGPNPMRDYLLNYAKHLIIGTVKLEGRVAYLARDVIRAPFPYAYDLKFDEDMTEGWKIAQTFFVVCDIVDRRYHLEIENNVLLRLSEWKPQNINYFGMIREAVDGFDVDGNPVRLNLNLDVTDYDLTKKFDLNTSELISSYRQNRMSRRTSKRTGISQRSRYSGKLRRRIRRRLN